MTCKYCDNQPCRHPITHNQPTINNIELPPEVARVGEVVKTARDQAALNRFRP